MNTNKIKSLVVWLLVIALVVGLIVWRTQKRGADQAPVVGDITMAYLWEPLHTYFAPYQIDEFEVQYSGFNEADIESLNILFAVAQNPGELSDQQKTQLEYMYEEIFLEQEFEIADAPQGRAIELMRTKACLADAVVGEYISGTSPVGSCMEDVSPNNVTWTPDDIVAIAQIAPYYLSGVTSIAEDNPERATYYLQQVTNHYQVGIEMWGDLDFQQVAGPVYVDMVSRAQRTLGSLVN